MKTIYTNKKVATPFEVATAKIPPWLFAKVEEFRNENELQTRNATMNVLLTTALGVWGNLDQIDCINLIKNQGIDHIPDRVLDLLSFSEEEVI